MERIFLPQANFLKQLEKKPAKKENTVEVVSNEFANETVTNEVEKKKARRARRTRRLFNRKKAEE